MKINGVDTGSITKVIGVSIGSVSKFNGVPVTTPVPLTSFSSSSMGDPSTGVACTLPTDTTRYHNGLGSYPNVGDYVYTNSSGTITFDSNNDYYKNGDNNAMVTDVTGQVTLLTGCRR
jgi:hypothetical protein